MNASLTADANRKTFVRFMQRTDRGKLFLVGELVVDCGSPAGRKLIEQNCERLAKAWGCRVGNIEVYFGPAIMPVSPTRD